MKFIDKTAGLSFLNAPDPDYLAQWCRDNGFNGVEPSKEFGDDIMASALYYGRTNYPDADNIDVCSFAGLVAYLATGMYGGFGTEEYKPERQAENIILAWAGGMAPPPGEVVAFTPVEEDVSAEFTRDVLSFLDAFYFVDREKAVADLISRVDKAAVTRIVLALSESQTQYHSAIDMLRAGEVLTASQVADEYGVTRRNVVLACQTGRLTEKEAILTPAGWIVTRAAAGRLWGNQEG